MSSQRPPAPPVATHAPGLARKQRSGLRAAVPLGLTLLLSSCATSGDADPPAERAPRSVGQSAAVLDGAALQNSPTLVEAFKGRVPSLQVGAARWEGACPFLTLRTHRRPSAVSSPLVFVDGARTTGTCVLTDLSPREVERVEIYPSGVPPRPGYAPHANGLILVFMKRSAGV